MKQLSTMNYAKLYQDLHKNQAEVVLKGGGGGFLDWAIISMETSRERFKKMLFFLKAK